MVQAAGQARTTYGIPNILGTDYFVYRVNFLGLLAGASDTGNIQIQSDSHFLWQRLTFFADIAGAAQTADTLVVPLVTMQITDQGSGRNIFQDQLPVSSIAGTGMLPYINPEERLIKARSSVTISVTNFSAATGYNLRLQFIGTKLFYAGV